MSPDLKKLNLGRMYCKIKSVFSYEKFLVALDDFFL